MGELFVKRIYESVSQDDGSRVLVDRLWPRGVSKEKAAIDLWAKNVAPSTGLRKEYHNNLEKYYEFREKYWQELKVNVDACDFMDFVRKRLRDGNVTFLYAAKNMDTNHAIILKEWVEEQMYIHKS